MSVQSQKRNMKTIAGLLSQNLSYISGERESGPNGAKKQFLNKSAAFLRALGKDLGFTEMKVRVNPGGIGVSGEAGLYGMWDEGGGLFFELTQPGGYPNILLFRRIRHLKDYTGDFNQRLELRFFQDQDYEGLCTRLLMLKNPEVTSRDAEKDCAA